MGATVVAFTACGGGGGSETPTDTGTQSGGITGGGTTNGGTTTGIRLVKVNTFDAISGKLVYVSTLTYDSKYRLLEQKSFVGSSEVLSLKILHKYYSSGYLKSIVVITYDTSTKNENDISSELNQEFTYEGNKFISWVIKSKDIVSSKKEIIEWEENIPIKSKLTVYSNDGSILTVERRQNFLSNDKKEIYKSERVSTNSLTGDKTTSTIEDKVYKKVTDNPYWYVGEIEGHPSFEERSSRKLVNTITYNGETVSESNNIVSTYKSIQQYEHNITYNNKNLPVAIFLKETKESRINGKLSNRVDNTYNTYEYEEI